MFNSDFMDEILIIHMGGLGDVCLSESLFYSFSKHFKEPLVACGVRRYFNLFSHYFLRVENIESARWLFLFSQQSIEIAWKQIIFIGKDRKGTLRERFKRHSKEKIIFIDMYPDIDSNEPIKHVEEYQLDQLRYYSIEPVKKEIVPSQADRVILYPEKGFSKQKWGYENFLEIYRTLKENNVGVTILKPFDRDFDTGNVEDCVTIEGLNDVKDFFSKGGVFVSNDSGMAHLAGACGLSTVTIFYDFEPLIWHPRGRNISLKDKHLKVETVLNAIYEILSTK